MLRTQYVVVEHDGTWKIRFDGRHFGPYPTERAPKSGYEPRVMTQSPRTGELLVEWTRGEPHPVDMPRRPAAPEQSAQSLKRTA